MTYNELLNALLAFCPDGEMGEDNDGQLVFYTGLTETDAGGEIEPLDLNYL